MKLAIIGGGNMAEAMLTAILGKGLCAPDDVTVSDIDAARRNYLGKTYGVVVTDSNWKAVVSGAVVILAIKPQSLSAVMAEITGQFDPAQLVLSIIAGVSISTLSSGLYHQHIVRAMPNTPAQVGEGMTVWTATEGITEQQHESAVAILGTMGQQIYVAEEGDIDRATAVSGSGPAYFFLFVEAMVDAAIKLGLSRETALLLVIQTMQGSLTLLQKSGKEAGELRRLVTSPGGTTAAALERLDEGQMVPMIDRAVNAAYERARELGS